jgi:hypothetical protein
MAELVHRVVMPRPSNDLAGETYGALFQATCGGQNAMPPKGAHAVHCG